MSRQRLATADASPLPPPLFGVIWRYLALVTRQMGLPRFVGHGFLAIIHADGSFQNPQGIDNPERCGAVLGYRRFRCNRRWPSGPDLEFGSFADAAIRF